MEYSEEFNRGGVLSVYTINGNGAFTNIAVENLQPGQDYTSSTLVAKWINQEKKVFKDDYTKANSIDNYHLYDNQCGTFEVKDGILSCHDSSDWVAGATVMDDIYSDFTMEFKLRIDVEGTGWMSVGLCKNRVNGNHNNTGFSFMVQPDGTVYFFDSQKQERVSGTKLDNFSVGTWYNVKLVANGSNVSAYVNGAKVASYTDTDYREGFISFTSGMTDYSIDDLKITPMG